VKILGKVVPVAVKVTYWKLFDILLIFIVLQLVVMRPLTTAFRPQRSCIS
jgi:hypothetical protein